MDVSKRNAIGAVVTLSDGTVALRPWARQDAWFMAEASADPAIRRYNGTLDRLGFPAPPLPVTDAEAVISEFTSSWEAFATTGTPGAGVAFAIVDASSGELAGCCGLDDRSESDVAQLGYWIGPRARGRGCATGAATLLTRWLFDLGAARVVFDDRRWQRRVHRGRPASRVRVRRDDALPWRLAGPAMRRDAVRSAGARVGSERARRFVIRTAQSAPA